MPGCCHSEHFSLQQPSEFLFERLLQSSDLYQKGLKYRALRGDYIPVLARKLHTAISAVPSIPLWTKAPQKPASPPESFKKNMDISAGAALLGFLTQLSPQMNTPGAWRLIFVGPEPKWCRRHSNRNSTKPLTVKEPDVKHRALKGQQRAKPTPLQYYYQGSTVTHRPWQFHLLQY